MEIPEPLVAYNFFLCRMTMETRFKEGGRNTFDELCLYQVGNGKVILEEFFLYSYASKGLTESRTVRFLKPDSSFNIFVVKFVKLVF